MNCTKRIRTSQFSLVIFFFCLLRFHFPQGLGVEAQSFISHVCLIAQKQNVVETTIYHMVILLFYVFFPPNLLRLHLNTNSSVSWAKKSTCFVATLDTPGLKEIYPLHCQTAWLSRWAELAPPGWPNPPRFPAAGDAVEVWPFGRRCGDQKRAGFNVDD